jgi:hypothetical protein
VESTRASSWKEKLGSWDIAVAEDERRDNRSIDMKERKLGGKQREKWGLRRSPGETNQVDEGPVSQRLPPNRLCEKRQRRNRIGEWAKASGRAWNWRERRVPRSKEREGVVVDGGKCGIMSEGRRGSLQNERGSSLMGRLRSSLAFIR